MTSKPTDVPRSAVVGRSRPEGYARYARPRGDLALAPNFISEHAAPAMLCLLRGAEPRPYTPIPRDHIAYHVQPQDFDARPSSFVAHQALMDLYRTLKGHYGVHTDAAQVSDLYVLRGIGGRGGSGGVGGVEAGVKDTAGHKRARETAEATEEAVATSMPDGSSVEDFAKQADAYRLGQFRRQAQHVDNKLFSRACTLYVRGECTHGAGCCFVHIGGNGVIVPTAGSRAAGGGKDV